MGMNSESPSTIIVYKPGGTIKEMDELIVVVTLDREGDREGELEGEEVEGGGMDGEGMVVRWTVGSKSASTRSACNFEFNSAVVVVVVVVISSDINVTVNFAKLAIILSTCRVARSGASPLLTLVDTLTEMTCLGINCLAN